MKVLLAGACGVVGIAAHVQCVRAFAAVGGETVLGLGLLAGSFAAAAFIGLLVGRALPERPPPGR